MTKCFTQLLYTTVIQLSAIHKTIHYPPCSPLSSLTYATANNECASTLKLKSYNSLDNSASALCCNYSFVVVAVVAIAMPLKRLLTQSLNEILITIPQLNCSPRTHTHTQAHIVAFSFCLLFNNNKISFQFQLKYSTRKLSQRSRLDNYLHIAAASAAAHQQQQQPQQQQQQQQQRRSRPSCRKQKSATNCLTKTRKKQKQKKL